VMEIIHTTLPCSMQFYLNESLGDYWPYVVAKPPPWNTFKEVVMVLKKNWKPISEAMSQGDRRQMEFAIEQLFDMIKGRRFQIGCDITVDDLKSVIDCVTIIISSLAHPCLHFHTRSTTRLETGGNHTHSCPDDLSTSVAQLQWWRKNL